MRRNILITVILALVLSLSFCIVACNDNGSASSEGKLEKKLQENYARLLKANDQAKIDGYVFINNGSSLAFDSIPDGNKYMNSVNFIYIRGFFNLFMDFDPSLVYQMEHTTALDGMQTYEEGGYIVTWKYHPDNGLEGSIRIKK